MNAQIWTRKVLRCNNLWNLATQQIALGRPAIYYYIFVIYMGGLSTLYKRLRKQNHCGTKGLGQLVLIKWSTRPAYGGRPTHPSVYASSRLLLIYYFERIAIAVRHCADARCTDTVAPETITMYWKRSDCWHVPSGCQPRSLVSQVARSTLSMAATAGIFTTGHCKWLRIKAASQSE